MIYLFCFIYTLLKLIPFLSSAHKPNSIHSEFLCKNSILNDSVKKSPYKINYFLYLQVQQCYIYKSRQSNCKLRHNSATCPQLHSPTSSLLQYINNTNLNFLGCRLCDSTSSMLLRSLFNFRTLESGSRSSMGPA